MTAPLRIGSLCTGYGGLDMAVQDVLGGDVVWVADPDPGASRVLAHHHPDVPNLGDLTVTDFGHVEPVDVVCGGYPCQPFSTAGLRKGVEDERHIWPHIARALGVLRPRYAVFENVAGHLRRGFDVVLADLARLGFDAEWVCVPASDVGAPHGRRRLFLLAVAAADTPHLRHQRARTTRDGRPRPAHGRLAPTDAGSPGLEVGPIEPDGPQRPTPERSRGEPAADTDRVRRGPHQPHLRAGQPDSVWGRYAPAIRRWEHVTGRAAPRATDLRDRLNPAFVEWMQGLAAGHVTDVPGLTRTQQLTALGNGVVPQQAEMALVHLLGNAVRVDEGGIAA
ncbi:DNA cytosine methyltransferase [Streptomyces sp. HNM0574]|nr:DNA cytosine methyltransferase [Streptomyces sp. HNM0574]